MKNNKIFMFLANTFLLLLVLIFAYNLGFNTINMYCEYGLKITILSFAIGVPLFMIFATIFKLIDKKFGK